MRLIVARCEVRYSGRLTAVLPEALRLLMIKSDGSVMVHADTGGYKPQNWMTPPTVIEEEPRTRSSCASARARPRTGSTSASPRCSPTSTHDMGEAAALEKDGVERDLQEALADAPECCGEGFRLVRREWPTDIGPVDLMCRDDDDGWIAVEIKRIGDDRRGRAAHAATSSASGATRRWRACRGVLAAQAIKPQARVLAESRGIDWVEVDLAVAARRARAGPHAVRRLGPLASWRA